MDLNKLVIVGVLSTLALGACAKPPAARPTTFVPQTTVRVVTETKYEQLPNINVPATPDLKPVQFDLPRDLEADPLIKSATGCTNIPPAQQDVAFWERCGQFPIDPNSNLFIGMDQENFNNLTYNLETLRQYIAVLKERIAIANDQRSDARARNN